MYNHAFVGRSLGSELNLTPGPFYSLKIDIQKFSALEFLGPTGLIKFKPLQGSSLFPYLIFALEVIEYVLDVKFSKLCHYDELGRRSEQLL